MADSKIEPDVDVVLTGFEPFGGRAENRSWQVVEAVEAVPGVRIAKVQLPVDFAALAERLPALVARARRALVMVGESAQTQVVEIERVALNVIDARIPDNRGWQPRFEEVVPGAPLARYARWDAAQVAEVIASAGAPVHVSHHAGTYACNAALYLALDEAESGRMPLAPPFVGFVHVPVTSETETSTIAEGITRLILTFG
jgi:pyroglutamyl-peptidase